MNSIKTLEAQIQSNLRTAKEKQFIDVAAKPTKQANYFLLFETEYFPFEKK